MSQLASARTWITATLGAIAASVLAAPAAADNEMFQASAGARMSDGTILHQEVPTQSTPAGAEVYNTDFMADGAASVAVVGGRATATALVPKARTDNLPYALEAGAESDMTYRFHIDGVNTGERIPVLIAGGASIAWTNFAEGQAALYLSGESGDTSFFRQWLAISTGTLSGEVIHKADEVLYLMPGVAYDVQLYAKAFAYVNYAGLGGLSSYALATADPVFTVVGGYADRYRVVGVPQPDGTGSVPEPSAWALMLLGFGAIGTVLRAPRRRAEA